MRRNTVLKKLIAFLIAFTMVACNMYTGGVAYAATENADVDQNKYEDVEELDDTETELQALGFDTDEMPEGYDEDSDENPNGSEYATLQEISELMVARSGSSTLYGHNGKLEDKYSDFFEDAKARNGLNVTNDSFTIAEAGCFDGNGRKNDMAYLTIDKDKNVNLRIYNSRNDESSEAIKVDQLTDENKKEDYIKSMDICTGDFDGDGLDEIATISAGSERCIAIYKIVADNVESATASNWKNVWTYSIKPIKTTAPLNSLDLVAGDVDGDGTDDLIASWGTVKLLSESTGKIDGNNTTESKSIILYGDKTGNMLRKSQNISYGNESLCRVAFTIGDIDENGMTEVLLGGSSIEQGVLANDSRTLGCYSYNKGTERLECDQMQSVKVVQGSMNTGSAGGSVWVSANGFDEQYLSLPGMKANISIVQLYGKEKGYFLYLDSVIYKFDNKFSIVDELDDNGKVLHEDKNYYEFGAAGAFMAGPANQGVTVNKIIPATQKYTCDTVYGENNNAKKHNLATDTVSANGFLTNGNFFTTIDTDQDSAVMRYTGRHKMIYSDPRVYAVLASAPYFEDVAEHAEGGSDIKDFSNTAWGSSSSKGDISGGTLSVSIGPSFTSEVFLTSQSEFNLSYQHTYTKTETEYTEYSVSYSTIAGEDCVVFFSVPGATYEYEVEYMNVDDDGNYEQETRTEYITIPYKPVSQTISLETYNEIQEENPSLPVIEGKAIKSKCGDPASYPSSSNGYKDALVYDGDWSAPSFSKGGDVSQEITKGKDTDTEHTNEGGFDFSLVWGTEVFRGGAHFDIMGGGVTGDAKSESTTASGTVYNMPPSAKGYDYFFSWKLMKYTYEDENGHSFPVVTYLTRDVTKPPALPTNFRQDYVNTSDSEVALTWTRNDNSVTAYDIYRHNEFTEGANDELIGTVKSGDYQIRKNKNGELIYDEETGETIKDYTFIDTGRSDYTEYEYRIQARRTKVPDISVPSAPITCKTRATFHPQVSLSDTSLTVYYDTIKNVSANVAEDDNFVFKNKSFQWQKYNSKTGDWEDLVTQTAPTLKFSKCTLATKGEYRCRVNSEISALGNTYRITAYSETLDVDYSKRDVAFGEVSYGETADGKGITFTIPITNCKDGARTEPQGSIQFALSDGQNESVIKSEIDSQTNTASATFNGLADGAYELTTSYIGNSKTFRDATNPDTFMYMKKLKSGKWLSLKKSYVFGEDLMDSLKLYDIENEGAVGIEKKDITDTISKVELKYKDFDGNEQIYASFYHGEDSAIPGIAYADGRDVPTELTACVYTGNELAQKRTFKVRKGKATLYLDDIDIDAGDKYILRLDSVKIKDAAGFEDGSSPYKFENRGSYTAFGKTEPQDELFSGIQIYTKEGDLVYNSLYGAQTIDLSTLKPGEYVVKPVCITLNVGDRAYGDERYYDITSQGSSLIIRGNTYKVSAYGEKVNGRYAGTVSLVSPDKLDEVTNARYQGGASLTFKAHPTTNYALKYWLITESGEEKLVEAESDLLTYKVQGTQTDITVKAVFALKENRISSHVLGGGTDSIVTCISDKIDDDQIVAQGKELTFEAKAGAGYEFLEWRYVTVDGKTTVKSGDISEDKSTSTATFTMGNATATVYAVFQRQKAQLNLPEHVRAYYLNTEDINPFIADGVEVAVASDNMVPAGATVILRPESGYKASGEWSVDGVEADAIRKTEGGSAIKFVIPEGIDVIKVNVTCKSGSFGITASSRDDSADIDIVVDGKPAESLDDVTGGSAVEFTAKPHRGYAFKKWIVNGDEVSTNSPMYATLVTANMDVEAVCEKVEGYKVKANIEGQGTVSYEIATVSGTPVTGQLSKEASEIELFDGESITFETKAGDSFMPSYIIRDNKRSEYSKNTYIISKLTENTSVTIGFEPAVFYSVSIENNSKYQLQSEDGAKLDKSISVGSLEDAVILIKDVTDPNKLFVTVGAETLTPEDCGNNIYKVVIKHLNKDTTLYIDDSEVIPITSAEDLERYRSLLASGNAEIDAIMENDITADVNTFANLDKDVVLSGEFDGNGHTIVCTATDVAPENPLFNPLFDQISSEGTVKNLKISGKVNCLVSNDDQALITRINNGKIDSCAFTDMQVKLGDSVDIDTEGFATAAFYNYGEITNCYADNVTVEDIAINNLGGIVVENDPNNTAKPVVRNCFVRNFYNGKNLMDSGLVVRRANTDVSGCYYDLGGKNATGGGCGENVWSYGKRTTGIELAYKLNGDDTDTPWGVAGEKDENPVPRLAFTDAKAPMQVKFQNYSNEYTINNSIKVPTEEASGAKAWASGDTCYVAGTIARGIETDVLFKPVGTPTEDYCAAVTYDDGAQLFRSIEDAIRFAKNYEGTQIAVIADAEISSAIEINNTEIFIKNDVTVTIKTSGSVENNATMNITDGGSIINYGSFQNNKDGVMNLGEGDATGSFINNGSFENYGKINDPSLIKCKNHSWSDKIVVKEPTYTEEGQYKMICNACLAEKTGTIPRLEEEVTLELSDEAITIANGTDKAVTATVKPEGTIGKVTWTSDNDAVAAVTAGEGNTGLEAVISGKSIGTATITAEYTNDFDYSIKKTIKVTVGPGKDDPVDPEEKVTLSLSTESADLTAGSTSSVVATVEPEEHLGHVYWSSDDSSVAEVVTGADDNSGTKAVIIGKSAGSATITAEYRNEFGYSVKKNIKVNVEASKLEILYEGNKISDSAGKSGNIDLAYADGANTGFAALLPEDTSEISWSSSNTSVMRVSCVDGVVTVTPVKTGSANLIATTEDKCASCAVRFVVPATGLTLDSAAITLDKGKSQQIGVNLSPSDCNERLIWESDNPAVAVVSGAGVVTAISEGTANITATTEGALGNSPKSSSLEVTVKLVGPAPEYKKIVSAKANSNKIYTGSPVVPAFTVTGENEEVLVADQDYTVTCKSNVEVGTATATIKGIGKYRGEVTCTFKVNPMTPAVKSITKGKRKMTVKMTTAPSGKKATTYQIAYRQKGTSTWKYTTTSTASKKIGKLKKRKYYYVKVRSIKTISGETYYGAWTKEKRSPKIR